MSSDPLFDCADFSIVCTVSILDVLPRIQDTGDVIIL
jgi:hypothetical protein